MHIIEIKNYGAPEVLVAGERPLPVAGAGELLIRVAAKNSLTPFLKRCLNVLFFSSRMSFHA